MLAVTLMPTLRSMLNQQNEINNVRNSLGQQRETVAAMQQQQRQWSDPAFIEQQARERLKFVRVGETSYTVIDTPTAAPATGVGAKIAAPARATSAGNPWYGQLWESMVIADTPAVAVKAPVKAPAKAPVQGTSPAASSPAR
jgi:hypothetical protein